MIGGGDDFERSAAIFLPAKSAREIECSDGTYDHVSVGNVVVGSIADYLTSNPKPRYKNEKTSCRFRGLTEMLVVTTRLTKGADPIRPANRN